MTRSISGSSLTQILMVILVPRLVPSGANKTRDLVELMMASDANAGVRTSSVSPMSSLELLLLSVNTRNWLGLVDTH